MLKYLREKGGDTLIKKAIYEISQLVKKIYLAIKLEKNIPLDSRFAGGSANAAAIVRAIFKLYDIKNNINITES